MVRVLFCLETRWCKVFRSEFGTVYSNWENSAPHWCGLQRGSGLNYGALGYALRASSVRRWITLSAGGKACSIRIACLLPSCRPLPATGFGLFYRIWLLPCCHREYISVSCSSYGLFNVSIFIGSRPVLHRSRHCN